MQKYMKKDLKNVIVTFGLIAIVFTFGSFQYKKSTVENDLRAQVTSQTLLAQQQKAETDRLKQEQILVEQKAQIQLAIQKSQIKNSADQAAYDRAQADTATKQAQILLQQQALAKAQALADAKNKAIEQAQILAQQQAAQQQKVNSRQSKAS